MACGRSLHGTRFDILNINEGKKWPPMKTTGVYFVKFQAFAPLHPRLQRCAIPSVPSSFVAELTELDIRLSSVCDRLYADSDSLRRNSPVGDVFFFVATLIPSQGGSALC